MLGCAFVIWMLEWYVTPRFSPLGLCRPELFDWSSVEKKTSAIDRLEHAFNKAEQHLGIVRLLDPEGNWHTQPSTLTEIKHSTECHPN